MDANEPITQTLRSYKITTLNEL